VNILCAVETRGATGADTVCAQGLNGLVFEDIVGEEVVEVVRGKVRDGAAIGELRLGAGRSAWCSLALVRNTGKAFAIPNNNGSLLVVQFLEGSSGCDKRFWRPIFD